MDSSELLVFIHYYHPRYLRYAYYQALSQGYDAVLIGDAGAQQVKYANFWPIETFASAIQSFADVYQHVSVNSQDYEFKCFTRWFVLYQFMMDIGEGRRLVVLDSDILAFKGLNKIGTLLHGRSMLDTAWTNCFSSADSLREFCHFLIAVYSDPKELNDLSVKYSISGRPHLSDMHLLWEFADRNPEIVSRVRHKLHLEGFDNSLPNTKDYCGYHGVKLVQMIDRQPHCKLFREGEDKQFATLHFQGFSKPLMECFHTIENESHLKELEKLGPIWWENVRDKDNPLARDIHSLYNELTRSPA